MQPNPLWPPVPPPRPWSAVRRADSLDDQSPTMDSYDCNLHSHGICTEISHEERLRYRSILHEDVVSGKNAIEKFSTQKALQMQTGMTQTLHYGYALSAGAPLIVSFPLREISADLRLR